MRQGKVVIQGAVQELLHDRDMIEIKLLHQDQLQRAYTVLQQAKEQGKEWLHDIEIHHKGPSSSLLVSAASQYAADINILLMQQQLIVGEIHPLKGNLEQLFLSTTATAQSTDISNGQL